MNESCHTCTNDVKQDDITFHCMRCSKQKNSATTDCIILFK